METKFRCGYCGAEYDTPTARARCELECDEKLKQEAEKKRQQELSEAKEARRQELIQKKRELDELTAKYYSDYGSSPSSLIDALFEQEFPMLLWGRR